MQINSSCGIRHRKNRSKAAPGGSAGPGPEGRMTQLKAEIYKLVLYEDWKGPSYRTKIPRKPTRYLVSPIHRYRAQLYSIKRCRLRAGCRRLKWALLMTTTTGLDDVDDDTTGDLDSPRLKANQNPTDTIVLALDDLRTIAIEDMAKQGLRPA